MTPLRFSFCLSLGIHVAVCGVATLAGMASHKAQLPDGGSEPLLTLTLVAAPDEPAAVPAEAPSLVVPAVPVPPPPETPSPAEPPPPPVPVEPTIPELKPVAVIPSSNPISKEIPPAPPMNVPPLRSTTVTVPSNLFSPQLRGDGSSAQAGKDATTQQVAVGTRARPDYRINPEPKYPPIALRRRQEGTVLLSVKVSPQGRVVSIQLKKSSGVTVLDEAALQAVRDWEFVPARIGATPVESEIEVPVRFKL